MMAVNRQVLLRQLRHQMTDQSAAHQEHSNITPVLGSIKEPNSDLWAATAMAAAHQLILCHIK